MIEDPVRLYPGYIFPVPHGIKMPSVINNIEAAVQCVFAKREKRKVRRRKFIKTRKFQYQRRGR